MNFNRFFLLVGWLPGRAAPFLKAAEAFLTMQIWDIFRQIGRNEFDSLLLNA
jgi:hypothetical protein